MKRALLYFYVSSLLLLPLILIVLPSDFFDTGKSVCVSVLLFDQTCYGCGMTRAIQHLLHLDFVAAWEFNKLSFIVLVVVVSIWFAEVRRTIKKIKNNQNLQIKNE